MKKANILVVDDEHHILTSLERVLMAQAYKVYKAASGAEALEVMAKIPIDLILSDMRMPEMNGHDLLNKVKELYPLTIRMAMSGYADEIEMCQALMDDSAKMFLSKPFRNDEVIKTIEQVINYGDKL